MLTGARGRLWWPAARSKRRIDLGLDGDGVGGVLRRKRRWLRDADDATVPKMASNDDEVVRNGDGGDGVLRPALKTTAAARASGDESRAARHGVRVTRVLGVLNSPGRRALHGLPKRQRRRRWSPTRRQRAETTTLTGGPGHAAHADSTRAHGADKAVPPGGGCEAARANGLAGLHVWPATRATRGKEDWAGEIRPESISVINFSFSILEKCRNSNSK